MNITADLTTTRNIGPLSLAQFAASWTLSLVPQLVSAGSSSTVTVGDAVLTNSTAATIFNNAASAVGYSGSLYPFRTQPRPVFTSSDPTVATVDAYGAVTRVGAGDCTITLQLGWLTFQKAFSGSTIGGQSISQFQNYTAGSLARAICDATDALVNAGGDKNIYTSFSATAAVKNPACWAAGLDFSGVAIWNSMGWSGEGGPQRAGVAVSPQDVIFAHHFTPNDGTTLYFLANDGSIVSRTVTSVRIGGASDLEDIQVGHLNAPLPSTVTFYKVMPANLASYFSFYGQVPVIRLDQERKALISNLTAVGAGISFGQPSGSARNALFEGAVPGDSGSPVFFNRGSELIFAGTLLSGAYCPSLHANITAINAAMTTLGGSYQLTVANLTGYPTF